MSQKDNPFDDMDLGLPEFDSTGQNLPPKEVPIVPNSLESGQKSESVDGKHDENQQFGGVPHAPVAVPREAQKEKQNRASKLPSQSPGASDQASEVSAKSVAPNAVSKKSDAKNLVSNTNPSKTPIIRSQSNEPKGKDGAASNANDLTGSNGLEEPQSTPAKRSGIWKAMPSWLVSTVVHVAVILVLGAWNIEPITKELKMMLVSGEAQEQGEQLQNFAIDDASIAEMESVETPEQAAEAPNLDSAIAETTSVDLSDVVVPMMSAVSMPSMTQNLTPSSGIAAQASSAMKAALNGRSKEAKRDLLKKFGGTNETERAVSLALKWLAEHQDPGTGAWTLAHGAVCRNQCDHSGERLASFNAATGLALMCYLGAGQTHMEGEYKEVVFKGLSFLIRNMKFRQGVGQWYVGDGGQGLDDMYAHGIATIALCEAFGMTKDPALLEAAQAGVNFLAFAQNDSTGGWHYAPKGQGDTSVVGWQMMALKSAAMSGLTFDIDVVRKANYFLDQMAWNDGTSYFYDFNSKAKQVAHNKSCTACALLCRMYSGMSKENASLKSIVERFNQEGPDKNNTYYNYYATQVMKQVGGAQWDSWNVRMRDQLVSTQAQSGHSTGSWYWDDGHSTQVAGRFYTTCMATMILEVYYRYLPIYAEQAEEDAFQL